MGILQTLTLVLRRLDPDNALWEQIQKKRAKARAGATFDTHDQAARSEALREISDTFEKYRQSDFGRKLYLIQNAIYGVDIQPIACQIAKLRFFISLVIEQDPDLGAPNLGIKPLPNLETRLVAADSLLSFKAETGDLLHHNAVASKQREVAAVRDRYFLADSRPKKLECMQAEKRLRDELQDILETERRIWVTVQDRDIESMAARFPNADTRETFRAKELGKLALRQREYDETLAAARLIAEWDPYDQNAHAGWFDPEYMFDVSAGFDVVIGNPPYIQLQKDGGRARKKYQNAGYETFASTGDIYQLFYERGCGLLKPRAGVLAYITSNSWLKAEYGKPLRQWFAERHMPLQLIEMGKNVFENAIVDTAVLIVRNGTGHPVTCPAVDVDQASENRFPPPKGDWGTLQPEGDRPWMALSSVERSVMEKMETVGTPLREWDISIYRGILTGYNDAFIIDTAVRDRLIAEDPSSEEILKPILRGRDIARYRANWADLWLISTFPSLGLDIDAYPAIKRHLLSFGKGRLSQEGRQLPGGGRSRKKTSNAWYELQDTCSYHEEFGKAKLFWMHMTPYGRFVLAEPNVVCNQKCFMVTGMNLEYLCAVLNSKLVTWLVRRTAVTTGMGLPQWDKFTVERVPVVQPDHLVMDEIGDIVESILAALERGDVQEVARLQRMIDSHVFGLYELTEVEREAVSRAISDSLPIQ